MKPRVKTGKRIHGKYNSNPLNKIPNPCCFFKLIVSPSVQLKNLRLPETFARAYRNEISEACHLKVPTGETHQVALVEQDCKLWFRDGWEQFVDRFSIGFGFFMVFTYVGNSNFKVNLFDPTACEISYSCDKYASSPMQSSEPNLGDHIPELSEEFNGDDQMNVDEENTHLPSADREKSEVDVKLLNKDVEIKLEELSDTDVDTRKETEGSQLGIELPIWLSNCKEELKAVAASGFPIPTNPFFVALMKSYVLTNGFLGIPMAFARCHMNCKAGDLIKIEMWDGKHWLVRCCRSRTYFSFGKGWLQFVRHACLEVWDVCLFELTDAKNCVLKVHISKFF